MDENERPDMADEVDDIVEEMGEDDELREEIKLSLSKQRQERLLDTDADREASEAAERAEALEQQQTEKELSLALRGDDELEAAAGEEAEEDEVDEEDEEAAFDALSQAEQDAANPHMEEGMNEEQKEDARLELAVDRTIGSAAVRHAVQMEVELTLLDSDSDDFVEGTEEDDELEAAEDGGAAADGSDEAGGERASRQDASGVTAPDMADASATAHEAEGATIASHSEADQAAVSRRAQTRRREAANLSKLFSYNGSKPEQ